MNRAANMVFQGDPQASVDAVSHRNQVAPDVAGSGRIRIVHLVNDLVPGGKEQGLIKLLKHMDGSLFERTLIVFSQVQFTGDLPEDQCPILCLHKEPGNDWRLPFRLSRLFRHLNPHIVHTHSWGTLVEGVLAARWAGVPVIIHGEHGTFPRSPLHLWVQKIFWRKAHRLLSVSGMLADQLSAATGVPRSRFEIILNGVDPERFFPDPALRKQTRQHWGIAPNQFLIGSVGRLHPVKNYRLLIQALARLGKNGTKPFLWLVGKDDGEGPVLKQLARELGVEANIRFLDFTPNINAIYNALDLFVLSSLSEGCSNVLQEAQFVGVPVVATRVGGNPELVVEGKTGLLVESDNPRELARAIQSLMQDKKLYARLKQGAREHARKTFSLEKMVQSYQQIYLEEYQKRCLSQASWPGQRSVRT